MNKNILLAEGIHPKAKECFEEKGFKVFVQNPNAKNQKARPSFCALGIRSSTKVDAAFLKTAEGLLSIGAFCIGTNQIDMDEASERGIAVFNSPYSNTRSVAELVMAGIVNLSRKIMLFNHQVHSGRWEKTSRSSYEVRGKTLGIIGYGHIGSQVGILAESFGMRVFYWDIQKKLSLGSAKKAPSLAALLSQSDFVTLHVPQTPKTKNLISKKELALMKKGRFLINTSRGAVVDLKDLTEALEQKHLGGAAIDVFPEEPAANQSLFKNSLQKLENVILTPHIAGSTEEAQIGIAEDVSESLIHYLLCGQSTGSVNLPEIEAPPLKKEDAFRITNIHQNIPGILSRINSLASALNMNVQNQHLATLLDKGYLIMDVESKDEKQARELSDQVQKLKTSIRTRCLHPQGL